MARQQVSAIPTAAVRSVRAVGLVLFASMVLSRQRVQGVPQQRQSKVTVYMDAQTPMHYMSLADALTDVRAQPHSATARLRFELSPGTHSLQQPLDFSGLGPVELHGHSAASTVLSAGTELNASNFVDLGNGIFELHLRAAGLTDYGTLISGGLKDCQNNKTELFVNNQRLWLARWPNVAANGTWQWGRIANVTDAQTFVPEASAPLTALAQDPDLWLHGYWVYDWSDEFVAVANVSTRNGTIAMTTSTATPQVGGRWMAINAQSQLDAPGEYYIDRASGRLTVMFPPGVHPSNQDFSAVLSTLPHAIFTPNATALHLHDLTVAYARGSGIVLPDARGALLERLVVANHGGNGTQVHGVNNQVRNSDFFNLACMGLSVTGGNRTSLVPSNNVVDGNHIHDYALWKRTYQGGLFWAGVGNSYLNNVIENGPHNGILGGGNEADHLGGNNCIFVNNTLRHLAFETTDTGAFYSCGQDGQAWINRGNVIANCTFIDVRMHEPTALGYSSVQAIYLDDQMTGWTIVNNHFEDCQKGVFVGGGRQNIVYNNTFINVETALHLDDRGLSWQSDSCQPPQGPNYVNIMAYRALPAWQAQYNMTVDDPCMPVQNSFVDNLCCHCGNVSDFTAGQAAQWHTAFANNRDSCSFVELRNPV